MAVSIHAPTWGAPRATPCPFVVPFMFQSTHPHGARRGNSNTTPLSSSFQSTRPRGARPEVFTNGLARYHVSIHAPVWGATCRVANTAPFNCLFQSTRPRGARHFPRRPRGNVPQCFNPRARVERDPRSLGAHPPRVLVSIHAPVWGATFVIPNESPDGEEFQSTRPCGARLPLHSTVPDTDTVSIHAPVWGATSLCQAGATAPGSFNPRARVGRDGATRGAGGETCLFQSTRPCGARRPHSYIS